MAANSAPVACPYAVCDNNLAWPTCMETTQNPYKAKKCHDGEYCIMNQCMTPTGIKYHPGFKAKNADECTTGKFADGYCRGMTEGQACVAATSDSDSGMKEFYDPDEIIGGVRLRLADIVNECDVGLACVAKVCKKVQKIGEDCAADKPCQGISACNKGKCVMFYTLKEGEEAIIPELCESMVSDGKKCLKVTDGPEKVWLNDVDPIANACKYNAGKLLASAQCLVFSGKADHASYCREFTKVGPSTASMKKYADLVKADNKLFGGNNPLTEEMLMKLDETTRREILDANFFFQKIVEEQFPSCLDKPSEAYYKRLFGYSYGLGVGILSLLALLLLVL